MKIDPSRHQEIATAYRDQHITMIDLAKQYGVTRQMIMHILRAYGVDTSKATAAHISVRCAWCGSRFDKCRKQALARHNHFCCEDHYFQYLNRNGEYVDDTHGREKSRRLVSQYMDLKPGYIVHHKDRDASNTNLSNLMVFACQGDHNRHHRGFDVKPVWDGNLPGVYHHITVQPKPAPSRKRNPRKPWVLQSRPGWAPIVDLGLYGGFTAVAESRALTRPQAIADFVRMGRLNSSLATANINKI